MGDATFREHFMGNDWAMDMSLFARSRVDADMEADEDVQQDLGGWFTATRHTSTAASSSVHAAEYGSSSHSTVVESGASARSVSTSGSSSPSMYAVQPVDSDGLMTDWPASDASRDNYDYDTIADRRLLTHGGGSSSDGSDGAMSSSHSTDDDSSRFHSLLAMRIVIDGDGDLDDLDVPPQQRRWRAEYSVFGAEEWTGDEDEEEQTTGDEEEADEGENARRGEDNRAGEGGEAGATPFEGQSVRVDDLEATRHIARAASVRPSSWGPPLRLEPPHLCAPIDASLLAVGGAMRALVLPSGDPPPLRETDSGGGGERSRIPSHADPSVAEKLLDFDRRSPARILRSDATRQSGVLGVPALRRIHPQPSDSNGNRERDRDVGGSSSGGGAKAPQHMPLRRSETPARRPVVVDVRVAPRRWQPLPLEPPAPVTPRSMRRERRRRGHGRSRGEKKQSQRPVVTLVAQMPPQLQAGGGAEPPSVPRPPAALKASLATAPSTVYGVSSEFGSVSCTTPVSSGPGPAPPPVPPDALAALRFAPPTPSHTKLFTGRSPSRRPVSRIPAPQLLRESVRDTAASLLHRDGPAGPPAALPAPKQTDAPRRARAPPPPALQPALFAVTAEGGGGGGTGELPSIRSSNGDPSSPHASAGHRSRSGASGAGATPTATGTPTVVPMLPRRGHFAITAPQ